MTHFPSIYYIDQPSVGHSDYMGNWPDEPGAKVDKLYPDFMGSDIQITFTTSVNTNNGGYDVTFGSVWGVGGNMKSHTWLYHISSDRKAEFVSEEGDTLPGRPEGAPL